MEACIDLFESVCKKDRDGKTMKLLALILSVAVVVLEMAAYPPVIMSVKECIQSGMERRVEEFEHDIHVGVLDVEIPIGTFLGKYAEDAGKTGNLKESIFKEELADIRNSVLSDSLAPADIEVALSDSTIPDTMKPVLSDTVTPALSDLEVTDSVESALPDLVVPDTTNRGPVTAEPVVPDITNQDSVITEPVMPGVEDGVITDPGATIPAAPDLGMSDPANSGKNDADSAFLIDEAGMLYGFLPEKAVIMDGVLELPMEGCIGIYKGVFAGYGENIIELYIPSNISVIEDGAFVGLDSLEWIEAEGENPGCVSVDGVLFDSSLTSLLAFPNGRTGAYIVPANVTRIADGAFANTSLSVLDMRACGNVMMGDGMFGGSAGESVEILMPRGYFAE